jgi:hypothetical protein
MTADHTIAPSGGRTSLTRAVASGSAAGLAFNVAGFLTFVMLGPACRAGGGVDRIRA